MKVVADLQIHSRFSRAVSSQMTLPVISEWAAKKGIGLVATGDWTHPLWFRELKGSLEEAGEGIYKLKGSDSGVRFLLSTEVSSIYSQGGKVRKIHTLIFAPNFEVVEKINRSLTARGANLLSDGRPIVGLSAKVVAEIALGVDPSCLIIPAHAWTPHFSLFGAFSGFDSIEECFGDISRQIFAIETGLSSDPAMNWRIEELSTRSIVSFSDAHSPAKLGREATVFEIDNLSYKEIRKLNIAYTIEFYPEEGKYHFTGHRSCKVVYSPNEARKMGATCPVCGKQLTIGVMSRVEHLASLEGQIEIERDKAGVRWIYPKDRNRPPYVMMVPLMEILAESFGVGAGSKKVLTIYDRMISSFGSELVILLETDLVDIAKLVGVKAAEGIKKVRSGDIAIEPGYDGVFGKVKIWQDTVDQTTLF